MIRIFSIRSIFFLALAILVAAVAVPLYKDSSILLHDLIMDLGSDLLQAKLEGLLTPIEQRYRRLERIGLSDSAMHLKEAREISLKELEAYRYKRTGRIFVIGKGEARLVPYQWTPEERGRLWSQLERIPEGVARFKAGRQEYLVAYRYYPRWKAYVGLAITSSELFEPLAALQHYSLLVTAAVILVGLVIVVLLHYLFIHPIILLASYADKVAAGEEVADIPGFFYMELATLKERMAQMVRALVERMEKLRAREEELRGAYELLSEEKERLAVTLRSIGDGVVTTDVQGRVVLLNWVAEELTGWSQDEAQGKRVEEVFYIVDERDGSPAENPVYKVLETGEIVTLSNHAALISRNGEIRSIADSGAPIKDEEGNILGVVLVFRDVTEKKRMQEELLKVKKLESIGVLAGGIAHDFNNILTAILGNINLARAKAAGRAEVDEPLEQAEKACARARALTNQLLTFAKGGAPILAASSLKEVVEESAGFVLRGSNIGCRFRFPDDLWLVRMDPDQISQVIQNIVLNARQAMPTGGNIEISARNMAGVSPMPHLRPGNYVELTIRDDGPGIPPEIQEQIFDPFFTTKEMGSGLGLAICHSIVGKHDGGITFSSRPGQGTSFTIYLPAAKDGGGEKRDVSVAKGLHVLIMDDEEMVREIGMRMLESLGHRTEGACNGEEAMELFEKARSHGDPFDLVLLDLTVPGGPGGLETLAMLRKVDSHVRAVVLSGYSDDPVMAGFERYGFQAALAKPYRLADLQEAIARAMVG